MTSRTSDETRALLLTLLAADIQDEGLEIGIDLKKVAYRSAAELKRVRGRLEFTVSFGKGTSVSVHHVWDDQPQTRKELEEEVEEIMETLRSLREDAAELMKMLSDAKAEGRKEAKRCAKLGMMVSFHGVSLAWVWSHSYELPPVVVTFGKLGAGLQPILDSIEISDPAELAGWFGDEFSVQARLADLKKEVVDEGADGLIDMALYNALISNGVDPLEEISRISDFASEGVVQGVDGNIRTMFRDGRFTGIFEVGPNARYAYDELLLELPNGKKWTKSSGLVREVIDHHYLPPELRFLLDSTRVETGIYHPVQPVLSYFNMSERRIWPQPYIVV